MKRKIHYFLHKGNVMVSPKMYEDLIEHFKNKGVTDLPPGTPDFTGMRLVKTAMLPMEIEFEHTCQHCLHYHPFFPDGTTGTCGEKHPEATHEAIVACYENCIYEPSRFIFKCSTEGIFDDESTD